MKRLKPKVAAAPLASDKISYVKRRPNAALLRNRKATYREVFKRFNDGYTLDEIVRDLDLEDWYEDLKCDLNQHVYDTM